MSKQSEWKKKIVKAAKEAKRGALAAAKHADNLMQVARQEVLTAARHRKVKKTLREASSVMKSAGKAALAAGAVAAMAAVAREVSTRKKLRS